MAAWVPDSGLDFAGFAGAGPTILEWPVLRAVEQVLDDSDGKANRTLARVIAAADSFTKRCSSENARLFQRLQAKDAYGSEYSRRRAASHRQR